MSHITVADVKSIPGVVFRGNGVIYFLLNTFSLNFMHFCFSKQFPTLPRLGKSPENRLEHNAFSNGSRNDESCMLHTKCNVLWLQCVLVY